MTFERPGNKLVPVHVSTMRDRELHAQKSLIHIFFSLVCLQTMKYLKSWLFQWCNVILLELI